MIKVFARSLLLLCVVVSAVCFGGCGNNQASTTDGAKEKLVIYTSMKENLIGGVVEGFKKKYPNVEVEYQTAGAGKLMAKIAVERQNGKILADIIWTSEVPDFYQMKKDGLLEQYRPQNFDELLNPFDDYDGSFTAARLGTLGIVINTDKVSAPPTSWEEITTNPLYKDSFAMADPALSGTSYMSVALLDKQFGWDYFVRLHDNGAKRGRGSEQVVNETASGDLVACLGVDYITSSKIDKGAPLAMIYPPELIMVPSPVAIFKDSPNKDTAKKFVDYMLGQEAQQKVADVGTVPVRRDVTMPQKYNLPEPEYALNNGIKVSYTDILPLKDETVKKFSELFR